MTFRLPGAVTGVLSDRTIADVVRTRTRVIGDRSSSPDPTLDGRDASASAAGLQVAGVLATLKHWPGHGSISTDSHAALAVIRETAQQWPDIDRAFFAAATSTAGVVMIGHLALPAIDPSGLPATLSPALVTGQLRHGLGYRGRTVTDSLAMEPMRAAGTPGSIAIQALRAGDEMLLETPDLPQAEQAVLTAITHAPGLRQLLRAAVAHLIAIKQQLGNAPRGHCR